VPGDLAGQGKRSSGRAEVAAQAAAGVREAAETGSECIWLITEGQYSIWFKTPIGEGAGVVDFGPDGELSGGDTTFSYVGNWEQDGERFKATLSAKRIEPGPPGVFGLDEIDITVTGRSDGNGTASCTGFAKQSPGLNLKVTLIRMRDERP
jgi:hypothetical protein